MSNSSIFLFVYGTLKRGDCRNNVLDRCRFVGTAKTNKNMTLYSCGAYPAMVEANDEGFYTGVEGEVYEVPTSLIPTLDAIEGTPYLYDRATIPVTMLEGKEDVKEAVTYIYQRDTKRLRHLGTMWSVRKTA